MSSSRFELPKDRPASFDESGARVYLKPDVARGFFFHIRRWLQPFLIAIFLGAPWVRVGGEPLILFDIPHRRFSLFGSVFWAHDVPMLFFIIAIFTLTVAFVTAVWGRVWCGWACPQTVFIEAVFRKLERLIEGFERGSYRTTKVLPEGFEGWVRWILKWIAFLAVSLVLAHAFIAYFVGTEHLMQMVVRPPAEAPGWFLFMSIVTAIVLLDFGWFREQFCIIACPYGRIQTLFIDDQSKLVAYDFKRGEPRKGTAAAGTPAGDCVNCFRCVQVCPTGIDIRRGNQLECIACTACIDACDEVMEKVKKPKGLIRYVSLAAIEGRLSRAMRPRTIIYLCLIVAAVAGFSFALSTHKVMGVDVLRAAGLPYELVPTDKGPLVMNHFHAEIWNFGRVDQVFDLSLSPALIEEGLELIVPQQPLTVVAGVKRRVDFFVRGPQPAFQNGKRSVELIWRTANQLPQTSEVELVAPAH